MKEQRREWFMLLGVFRPPVVDTIMYCSGPPSRKDLHPQLLGVVAADSPQLSAPRPLPPLQRAVSLTVVPFPRQPTPMTDQMGTGKGYCG